jgi:hypothetical protein
MSAHAFCRVLLSEARKEAKAAGVEVPKRMTAIGSRRDYYFVEMDGRRGEYITGDCAYDAKAKFIHKLIDASKSNKGNG